MRLILIFFQILKPVEPRSSSIGLNPIVFNRAMVALAPAAPIASFLKKLSSLLKLFATVPPQLIWEESHYLPDALRTVRFEVSALHTKRPSGNDLFRHNPGHVGQPKIAPAVPIRQSLVIESEQM